MAPYPLAMITTTKPLDSAREVLQRHFGYPDFRPGQSRAVVAPLHGRDCLVLMPTGGGKSLCFQVPSQLMDGVTIVVSPLISLMKDQVDGLARAGIPATFVNSTLETAEVRRRLDAVEDGRCGVLYVAPERFGSRSFAERLSKLSVGFLVIDEAHCISQWGHDFRPSYMRLGEVRDQLAVPTMALTATATPEVRDDIIRHLRLRDPILVAKGFDRPNLRWHVLSAANDAEKDGLLDRLLAPYRERSAGDGTGTAIVYATTRKAVDAVAHGLNRRGIRAGGYHAGIGAPERQRLQDTFMDGRLRVIVATNAFGMGIDKPDVRLVAHYNTPSTLEDYYQEAGRAGRDRQDADCVLLHAYADRFTHEFLLEQAHPQRRVVESVARVLAEAGGADGVVTLTGDDFARAARSAGGARRLDSVLRLLAANGALDRDGAAMSGAWIRVIASERRSGEELAREPTARLLLEAVRSSLTPEMAHRWAPLPHESALPALAPADRRRLLDSLKVRGLIDYRPRGIGARYTLASSFDPAALPVDWAEEKRKHKHDLDKLRRMQAYAYQSGCRRRYILDYFGEKAPWKCGRCDRCLAPDARIVPRWPAPSRSRRGR